MRHLKVASLALVLLSGCMVGPNYSRPSVPMAPGYKEYPPASFKEDDGWKVIQPSDAQLKGNWWELFGDPQLNTLEARVEGANCPCFSLSQSKGPLQIRPFISRLLLQSSNSPKVSRCGRSRLRQSGSCCIPISIQAVPEVR
jgi:hypothetical protein